MVPPTIIRFFIGFIILMTTPFCKVIEVSPAAGGRPPQFKSVGLSVVAG
jgi:hypothetical protein